MHITCPHCGFAKEIEAEQIPANGVRVTCPECKQPFPLLKEATVESNPTVVSDNTDSTESLEGATEEPVVGEPEQAEVEDPASEETGPDNAEHEEHVESEIIRASETDGAEPTKTARGEPDKPARGEPAEPASIAARYAALLIDGMLIMIMVMTLRIGLTLLGNGIQFEGQLLLGTIFLLFVLTLSFAYHTLFIGVCGQTPGKMLLRIRVVSTDCTAMTYRQAMLREVLGKILSLTLLLGYFMAMFNPRHLAAHDKIADTCVIKLITESTAD